MCIWTTTLSSEPTSKHGRTSFCFIFGTTVPFSNAQLDAQYDNPGGFVRAWTRATLKAVEAGFVRLPRCGRRRRIRHLEVAIPRGELAPRARPARLTIGMSADRSRVWS